MTPAEVVAAQAKEADEVTTVGLRGGGGSEWWWRRGCSQGGDRSGRRRATAGGPVRPRQIRPDGGFVRDDSRRGARSSGAARGKGATTTVAMVAAAEEVE